ncbi:heme-binding protein [Sphingomonas adhaesiva]|uniref:heme-binding protein n=1 Tax=Sphingomonas adhaesiva TaxID=28212 RepID=UPI002FF61DF5
MRQAAGALAIAALLLASCGGGGGGAPATSAQPTPAPTLPTSGRAYSAPAQEALTTADVGRIVAQAAAEAKARSLPAVIAVSDRVGNLLAVFRMDGARPTATAPVPRGTPHDVQGVSFPAELGAIAKALTGAYLSSGGNAFSTRTASHIVQEHFPPAPSTAGLESGPLFGVQFSQLPCSDLSARYAVAGGAGAMIGPKRSPLGLAADPGGMPLYKNGVLVGGIGVMADGVYGFDADIRDVEDDAEEGIAVAGSTGFTAPETIAADRISVDGTTLRFADTRTLRSVPSAAPALSTVPGALLAVRGYFGEGGAPAILAGTAYGSEASGLRAATAADFSNADAFVLSDGAGNNRYPITGGSDGAEVRQPLTAAEVRAALEAAFAIMTRARAQIRRPLDSRAQVSITVVDTRGTPLGLVRAPDAPIFGTDVALQKARSAAFFSAADAGAQLTAAGGEGPAYAAAFRSFLSDPAALTGRTAFSARALGNLARPYFPDGEVGRPQGPLSRDIADFNPFSTGLQSALVIGNLAAHIGYVASGGADTPVGCTTLPATGSGRARLANGLQIFPGGVPIYRGDTLVGAIGVSGDGIDQDDMIAFLGANDGGLVTKAFGNAAPAMRSDRVVIRVGGNDVRLRWVGCPFAPFLDTSDQNACSGK